MKRRLIYNAFTHVTPNHHSHGYWRHPEGRIQLDYKRLAPWLDLARTVERGKFDTVFLADVVGVYDKFRGNGDTSIRTAMQFPVLSSVRHEQLFEWRRKAPSSVHLFSL